MKWFLEYLQQWVVGMCVFHFQGVARTEVMYSLENGSLFTRSVHLSTGHYQTISYIACLIGNRIKRLQCTYIHDTQAQHDYALIN
jgi:hypothetical protein